MSNPQPPIDAPRPNDELNRTHSGLSQWSLAILVTASMIGAGIFTTSGFAMSDLRDPNLILLAWLVGGLIAICGAISYGQLARLMTENGGEYLFLSRFVHPSVGFVAGWVSFLAGFTGAGAFAAIAFEAYLLPDSARPGWLPSGSIAIALVAASTLVHALHTVRGAAMQNVLVVAKLLCIVVFLVGAFAASGRWLGGDPLPGTNGGVGIFEFATSVMWISLSYCGFNAAIYIAGESRGGWRDVAGAMFKAVLVVMVIYLLLNAVFVYGPPADAIAGKKDVATIAALSVGGPTLETFVRVAICLGLASSVSSTVMTGPRVYAKMASEGVFPRWFDSQKSPPVRSVVLQGAAISLVVTLASLRDLLSYLSLTLSICSAATVAILMFVARAKIDLATRHRLAASIYVIATLTIAGLSAWHRPTQAIVSVATFVSGWMVYHAITFRRRVAER